MISLYLVLVHVSTFDSQLGVQGISSGTFKRVLNPASIPTGAASTSRETKVLKALGPKTFKTFVEWCVTKTGKDCAAFLNHKDKMWPRLFGFGHFVLALCVTETSQVICNNQRLEKLLCFNITLYELVIRLYDASVGHVLDEIHSLLIELKKLWLENAVLSGVYLLPESVHQFFHRGEIIDQFGSMAGYAADFPEKYNKVFKSDVSNHSTHHKGATGEDFLKEPLVREQRQRIYRLMMSKLSSEVTKVETAFAFICKPCMLAKSFDEIVISTVKRVKAVFGLDVGDSFSSFDDNNDSWIYKACVLSLVDQSEVDAIGEQTFKSFSNQTANSLRVLALSPDTDAYRAIKSDLCVDSMCIPCLGLELGKTLNRNASVSSADVLFLPVAFRVLSGSGEVLCFHVSTHEANRRFGIVRADGSTYGGMGELSVNSGPLAVVKADRIRGESGFVIPKNGRNLARYLSVFRGKPGM
jgi:hypothetical protein